MTLLPTPTALTDYARLLEQSRKPFTGLDADDLACAELGAILAGPCAANTLTRALLSALSGGVKVARIESMLLHLAAYAGLAAAECGMAALEAIVQADQQHAQEPRLALPPIPPEREGRIVRGLAAYRQFHALRPEQQAPRFAPLSPDYYPGGMELMAYTFADTSFALRGREVASIACLAALGCCPDQLRFHVQVGLREGITMAQMTGIFMLVQVHAGVPRAHNAAAIAAEVVAAQTERPTGTL